MSGHLKIFLVGMPGSGKSTLGRPLAEALLLPFVDQDKEIERHAGKTVQAIFAEDGEAHFRLIESEVLKHWAAADMAFVMATGGGAPCFHDGMTVINAAGLSVFLDVPVEELLNRTATDKGRPLLQAEDLAEKKAKLTALYDRRYACYTQAQICLKEPVLPELQQALDARLKK
ncbi:shikimate kinase [Dawidia soli]|uniref:Shikimate kinase n=1 Tax=Dawidia soli TaxID=2782352 RepID=A0AAP2GJ92_9BACT|nr:shikimate kinase [Dawidia soli]MBT1687743.1 shikimate kinase [Dawidia soli]